MIQKILLLILATGGIVSGVFYFSAQKISPPNNPEYVDVYQKDIENKLEQLSVSPSDMNFIQARNEFSLIRTISSPKNPIRKQVSGVYYNAKQRRHCKKGAAGIRGNAVKQV